ncbi:MAG: trypsin-like peptidase domain-containing protein [Clostridia bacterium]|nr:trypsin-like peptidase domain-containing protein [Clostridia bacterium]
MNDYDLDEEVVEKIPYDQVPITRGNFVAEKSTYYQTKEQKPRWFNGLVALLLLINLTLGIVIVNLFIELKKPTEVYNMDISIENAAASDVSNAVTKAKFSAVCVNAGNSSVSTVNEFYHLSSRGSGVIIDIDKEAGDAYILTCYHVVSSSSTNLPYDKVYILPYGSSYPIEAEIVNYIYKNDICLLKVENSNYIKASLANAATIGDSASIIEGQTAVTIGNALNAGLSATTGVISVPRIIISVSSNSEMRVMKIDTPINSGNSGGGLFDINGNLIGIVNAKMMSSEVDNVAYAIPINFAYSIANSIKHYGSSISPKMATVGLGLTITGNATVDENGALIQKIAVNSVSGSAIAAGFKVGDVLISFTYNGKTVKVKSLYDITDNAYNMFIGDNVTFVIDRGGEQKTLTVIITNVS